MFLFGLVSVFTGEWACMVWELSFCDLSYGEV